VSPRAGKPEELAAAAAEEPAILPHLLECVLRRAPHQAPFAAVVAYPLDLAKR
jgi:hypothetical protein